MCDIDNSCCCLASALQRGTTSQALETYLVLNLFDLPQWQYSGGQGPEDGSECIDQYPNGALVRLSDVSGRK